MGACCSKFGTYFVKKEEGKAGHGSTPKLNKLEHKTSFVADKDGKNDIEEKPQTDPKAASGANGVADRKRSASRFAMTKYHLKDP